MAGVVVLVVVVVVVVVVVPLVGRVNGFSGVEYSYPFVVSRGVVAAIVP